MKVCLDIQPALGQRAGIGRYTRALAENLGAFKGDDQISFFCFDFLRRGVPFPIEGAELKAVKCCPGRLAQKSWSALGWPQFNLLAGQADLYHFPNFIMPPLSSGRGVVTIHDLSFIRHPQFAEERNLRWLRKNIARTAERACAIITDSNFSAGEIQEHLGVSSDRVFPIHLGLSSDTARPAQKLVDEARAGLNLDRPYILMVGTIEPRKNIEFLVSVFEEMSEFDGYLVLAGMRGWRYQSIFERIKLSPRTSEIRYLEYVPDSQLRALFAGAELFIFPSLYEGFGLPPLEAMACGTPVLSSSGGSLPEVLGDAAVILNGYEVSEWSSEAARIISDSVMKRELIEKGLARASLYSWRETARKTWAVYREAVL